MSRRKVVVASDNRGKLRELQALFGDGWALLAQAELGIEGAAETGATFLDNALLKARHAAAASGLPAIADDSGLEVDALAGAPGVHSARYAGEQADDAANNARLLAALAGVPAAERGARFRCVMVYVDHADAEPVIAEATWEGRIARAPRGSGGFGYGMRPSCRPRRRTGAATAAKPRGGSGSCWPPAPEGCGFMHSERRMVLIQADSPPQFRAIAASIR